MNCKLLLKSLIIILFIYEVKSDYQCKNGRTIDDRYFCDGDNDCRDSSYYTNDEGFGCDRNSCGAGRFLCGSNVCLHISVRCNGNSDCTDGTDEKACNGKNDELSLQDCTTEEGKFLCRDRRRCIYLNETCNGKKDCFDKSDETSNCTQTDRKVCENCHHTCINTPDGPHCFCSADNATSLASCGISESDDFNFENHCSQKYFTYRGVQFCTCFKNYELRNGNCFSNESHSAILLYSTTDKIGIYNFSSDSHTTKKSQHIGITALTGAGKYIYWAVNVNDKIVNVFYNSIYYNKIGNLLEINFNTTSCITSLAVDWVTRNIYFTASKSLSVCNRRGSPCTRLKTEKMDIESVVLASARGVMFWSYRVEEDSQSIIMKSAMDGSQDQILINEESSIIHSLAVDELAERLYWLDIELMTMNSIEFDGNNKRNEMTSAHHVSSFGTFANKLYLTLDDNAGIYSYNKNSTSYKLMFLESDYVKHIYAYNPLFQLNKVKNPCNNVPCKGLCVIRPSEGAGLNYTCLCEKFKITNGSNWCENIMEENSSTTRKNVELVTEISGTFSDSYISKTYTKSIENDLTTRGTNRLREKLSNDPHKPEHKLNHDNEDFNVKNISISVILCLLCVLCYDLFKKWKKKRQQSYPVNLVLSSLSKEDD